MSEKIVIIGAGVAGLVAARELENHQKQPLILDAAAEPGGHVATSVKQGYTMDHGFQVLLTAYPEARNYLNFDALDLKYFEPGAVIFGNERSYELMDPRRDWKRAIPMLFSPVGSLSDKIRLLKLVSEVRKQQVESIFELEDIPTKDDLTNLGFSERMINNFFRPFFSEIFLEKKLETSRRMFRFVLKMFAEGHAAIPAGGIQAIADQLAASLKQTEIRTRTKVEKIESNRIITDQSELLYDKLIIATNPGPLLKGFAHNKSRFREVCCLYFDADSSAIGKPMLGLVPGNGIVSNFHYVTDLNAKWAPNGRALLSATVVGPFDNNPETNLEKRAKDELEGYLNTRLRHLETFYIRQALPVIDDIKYSMQPTATKIQDNIFVAGDHLLNPSLNAAMLSGRLAAAGALTS